MNDKIIELSHHNVIVNRAVRNYQAGYCTWEEAMEELVIALCEANQSIVKSMENSLMNSPTVAYIQHGDFVGNQLKVPE